MYCPDTLARLDEKAINNSKKAALQEKRLCEYCGEKRVKIIVPIYNHADALRGVKGAYAVYELCQECADNEVYLEDSEIFRCSDCGFLFIMNHSWDYLAVHIHGAILCQECAVKTIAPVTWKEVRGELRQNNTDNWHRLNSIPKKELIWEGEFSLYSDFSGHTNFSSIISKLNDLLDENDLVYPIVSKSYQFSVVLSVYKD